MSYVGPIFQSRSRVSAQGPVPACSPKVVPQKGGEGKPHHALPTGCSLCVPSTEHLQLGRVAGEQQKGHLPRRQEGRCVCLLQRLRGSNMSSSVASAHRTAKRPRQNLSRSLAQNNVCLSLPFFACSACAFSLVCAGVLSTCQQTLEQFVPTWWQAPLVSSTGPETATRGGAGPTGAEQWTLPEWIPRFNRSGTPCGGHWVAGEDPPASVVPPVGSCAASMCAADETLSDARREARTRRARSPYCARAGDTPQRRRRSQRWRAIPHGTVRAGRARAAPALPRHRR